MGKREKGKEGRRRLQGRQAGEGKGLRWLLRGEVEEGFGAGKGKTGTGAKWINWWELGGSWGWGPWWERDPKSGDGGGTRGMDTWLGTPPINPRKQQVCARCSLLTAQEGRARVVIINNH